MIMNDEGFMCTPTLKHTGESRFDDKNQSNIKCSYQFPDTTENGLFIYSMFCCFWNSYKKQASFKMHNCVS